MYYEILNTLYEEGKIHKCNLLNRFIGGRLLEADEAISQLISEGLLKEKGYKRSMDTELSLTFKGYTVARDHLKNASKDVPNDDTKDSGEEAPKKKTTFLPYLVDIGIFLAGVVLRFFGFY